MASRREQRILRKKAGRFRMVRYIRHLFKLRPVMHRPNIWVCVMRERKIVVVRNFDVGLMDSVVMYRLLTPGEVPPALLARARTLLVDPQAEHLLPYLAPICRELAVTVVADAEHARPGWEQTWGLVDVLAMSH